jgi:isocitrate dehydrogenase kinase/phosphatase
MTPLEPLARSGVQVVRHAWERYRALFQRVTRRARQRFERADWAGMRHDAQERLGLYRRVVDQTERELQAALSDRFDDPTTWREMKQVYSESIAGSVDVEIAETFFNSVTRRVFDTVGVDESIEFVDLDLRRTYYGPGSTIHETYELEGRELRDVVEAILGDFPFALPYRPGDAERVTEEIERAWAGRGGDGHQALGEKIEVVRQVFYRGKGAYLVGRIRSGREVSPLLLALDNRGDHVAVDAVLTGTSEVSIVFSYTRSYFHVDIERPSDAIRFLRSIMPRKPVAELYLSLAYNKHGKTEMYRDLLGHLNRSLDLFQHAVGDAGMVMIVFTLPSFDYVFKVIRDQFGYPKTNTRKDVLERYQLVFQHDRAGRLVEAQVFEHLTFDIRRFEPDLVEELRTAASDDVTVSETGIHFHHLYLERRVRPLNLYLREVDEDRAAAALQDYGRAIRDLAYSNIFPGDMLLKNFGVTRHGRVIFYDYDELCLVTDCVFRDLPAPRDAQQELAAEPWYFVGEHDVFPEEFIHFLGLNKPQREAFVAAHGAVLTPDFWRDLQRRHAAGEVLEVFPYPRSKRL